MADWPQRTLSKLHRAKGYDFLAITDHRIMSYSRMDGNILLTGGVEFDYMLADQCIHIIGIGMMGEPKLDPPMRGASAQDAIDAINSLDGLAILAHPAWSPNTLAETMPLNGLSAMEIYNSTSGIPWNAARADSSSFVDVTYTHGKYTPVVAADELSHVHRRAHALLHVCKRKGTDSGQHQRSDARRPHVRQPRPALYPD